MNSPLNILNGSFVQHKLNRDIAWSVGSIFILAISGITINIVITFFRDVASLGVFNLSYVVYTIVAQFAVCGLHYSVFHYSAFFKESALIKGRILFSACLFSLGLGISFAGLTIVAAPLLARLFNSVFVGETISYAALGLILFPLNKVLVAYFNGLREMKVFSLLQSLRYFFVMLFVTIIAISTIPIKYATLGFFFAEAIVFLVATVFIIRQQHHKYFSFSWHWIIKHLTFGINSLPSGIFVEINSRIDVLLVALFFSDKETGIYSFAAMLVDGLYSLLAVVRINFNPFIVSAVRNQNWEQVKNLHNKSKKFIFFITIFLSLILMLVYYIMSVWILPTKGLLEGMPSLLILLCGLNIISIFIPFDNLLIASGRPRQQVVQQVMTLSTIVGFALFLLPIIGIEGAALGVTAGYLVSILMMIFFTFRIFDWNIITNRTANGIKKKKRK